jgi:adenine-specific DNA-methyltransferase
MRFIGNKENLLNSIYYTLEQKNIKGSSFFDFFSGTTNVARFFKKKNYKVFSSDLLYFSYCMQYAYIKNNKNPQFKSILAQINTKRESLICSALDIVLEFLNKIESTEGFIYKNYSTGGTSCLRQPRMYFSDYNAKRIDTIRIKLRNGKITVYCLKKNTSFCCPA